MTVKKITIIILTCVLVSGMVFCCVFPNHNKYSAVEAVVPGGIYNSGYSQSPLYRFCLNGDRIYYNWDGFYNLHISASDRMGRDTLVSDLQLAEGSLIGDVQTQDNIVYFPAKTDTGDCIFYCYADKAENRVKEMARIKANLGPWTVIGQTLIYTDYGETYTNENYTLYSYDLIHKETQVISSFVYGFSVRADKLFFLTGASTLFTVYEYDLANGTKEAVGEIQYSQNGEVLGMTDTVVVMHTNNTTDTDILVYNIVQKSLNEYTLPWKVNCFSAYENNAFLGFYHDANGSTKEIQGLYRLNLQNGKLQAVNEEIPMPISLFLINDSSGYVLTYESKWIFKKAVVYRFSYDDLSFEKVFSW